MFFSSHISGRLAHKSIKNTTLQVSMQLFLTPSTIGWKRMSASASASLTVESALVFPIFLFALTCFLYLGQILLLETRLQGAMESTVEKAASYYYVLDRLAEGGEEEKDQIVSAGGLGELISGGLTAAWIKTEVIRLAGSQLLEHSCIWGGSSGISMLGSAFSAEEPVIDLIISYQIRMPIPIFSGIRMKITQRCRRRTWTGTEEEKQEIDPLVYVTVNGSVYHTSLECTYLRKTVREVPWETIGELRNDYGGKYDACEICVRGNQKQTVYVTQKGNRYHNKLTCSGLSVGIRSIPISQAGDLPLCSRCQKAEAE